MTQLITTLTTLGPALAKTWLPDGTIENYGDAKQYRVESVVIPSLHGLHLHLVQLAPRPTRCIIRGQLIQPNEAAARGQPVLRRLDVFEDKGSHLFMVDVDNFVPLMYDALTEPADAVQEFVEAALPECFHQVSYVWQLSGSMGHPSKEGLRAHIWFWLDEPMTCSQAEQWSKRYLPGADHTVHRTVQVNYTADPIMGAGQVDPYAGRRLGLAQRESLTVVIPDDMPVPAHEDQRVTRAERATKLVDPRDKRGVIGAFTRAFEPADLADLCPDLFEVGTRVGHFTWRLGGGSPNGVFITDSGTHLSTTHSTAPLKTGNLFDFILAHKFGHLDADVDAEVLAFDQTARPSYVAMMAWAREQPEVQEQLNPTTEAVREQVIAVIEKAKDAKAEAALAAEPENEERQANLTQRIAEATTVVFLEKKLARELAKNKTLSPTDRERIAQSMQKATVRIEGGKGLPIALVRSWLKPTTLDGLDTFPHLTRELTPKLTRENLEVLLQRLGCTLRYDTIKKRYRLTGADIAFTTENYDNCSLAWLQSKAAEIDMPHNMQMLAGMVTLVADRNQFNPVLEWIESVPWDGKSRLHELAETMTLRSGFDPKVRDLMLRTWCIQAVAGVASHTPPSTRGVLTLQGPQYIGKTRWFTKLVGPHTDLALLGATIDPHNKDSVKRAISHWIVELGELGGTLRKSDQDALKAFLGNTYDVFRLPYAAADTTFPRRSVYTASVNEDAFLADDTGTTRWWVIPVVALDHNHEIDMQQLWAEMLQAWRAGEPHWMAKDDMQRVEVSNESFVSPDEIKDRVAEKFAANLARARTGDPEIVWVERSSMQVAQLVGLSRTDRAALTKLGILLQKLTGRPSRNNGSVNVRLVPLTRHEAEIHELEGAE